MAHQHGTGGPEPGPPGASELVETGDGPTPAEIVETPVQAVLTPSVVGTPPAAGPAGRFFAGWDLLLITLTKAAESLLVVAILAELVITFVAVWSRYLINQPIAWTEEIGVACLSLITFLGGAAAIRRGRGMALTFFLNRMPPGTRRIVQAAAIWASLIFIGVVLWTVPLFLNHSVVNRTPILRLPSSVSAVWLGIGYVLMGLFTLDSLRGFGRRELLGGAGLVVAGAAGLLSVRYLYDQSLIDFDPMVLLSIVFVLGFVAGLPIAFVLGLAGLSFILGTGTIPLAAAPVSFAGGISSFILLAIPFFMLAGVLMDMGGLAGRLVRMINPVVARLPGGLLITQVLAVYVFSGVSGSKLADIAAIGSVMGKPLREAGYEPHESTAVLAASAAMSETVPPSLTVIVLASITALSPGALFLAGILPAAVVALCLVAGIVLRSRSAHYPMGRPGGAVEFIRAVPGAIPALVLPVVLVVGIVAGIGTPTEGWAAAAVYGLVVAAAAYRSMRGADLWKAMVESSTLAGITLLILSTATLMSQMITIDLLPQRITEFLSGIGGRVPFLILTVGGLVLLGSLLEGLPAILIFAPLLVPIAKTLGIDPLQYGIVLVVAMGIGAFAPPIGVGLYVACAIGGTTVEKTTKPSLYYTVALLVGLALLVVFPEVTTVLPHLGGRH